MLRHQAERHPARAQFDYAHPLCAEGQVMPGVGVLQASGLRVEHCAQAGHEHIRWNIAAEHVIGARQTLRPAQTAAPLPRAGCCG